MAISLVREEMETNYRLVSELILWSSEERFRNRVRCLAQIVAISGKKANGGMSMTIISVMLPSITLTLSLFAQVVITEGPTIGANPTQNTGGRTSE